MGYYTKPFFSVARVLLPAQVLICALGDFQVWEKLFLLHIANPERFKWMIPMPGEWHWTWHIIVAIFRIYYISILLPFAKILGFSSLDPDARNFHYAENLL